MKKKCVIYVRASEIERTGALQLEELHEYAKSRSFEVKEIFEDRGHGPVDQRPKLAELLRAANGLSFDFIVISRLDRMFASHKHLMSVVNELQTLGIGLVSVRDGIDTLSQDGELIHRMFEVFRGFEARIIAERVLAGGTGQKRKGYHGSRAQFSREQILQLTKQGRKQKEIAQILSCSETTVSKFLKKHYLSLKQQSSS